MRLRFPLIPVAVHIRLEFLPWKWKIPRFSVRTLLLAVGLLAFLLGSYMTLVEMPARRQRYLKAEQTIEQSLDLLRRGVEEAIAADRETKELYERDLASIEKEEQEADKWPEGSEERNNHLLFASQWRTAAAAIKRQLGGRAEIAEAFRDRAEKIRDDRKRISNSLFAIETLASESDKAPDSAVWKKRGLARVLADLKLRTPVDPALLKATAIWQAKGFFGGLHPGIDPARLTLQARGQDFAWTVDFTDPKSMKKYPVRCFFSRTTVDQYLARQVAQTKRNIFGLSWL